MANVFDRQGESAPLLPEARGGKCKGDIPLDMITLYASLFRACKTLGMHVRLHHD
jgi:hypothetical protein